MAEEYWTVSRGPAVRNGWTCRECRKPLYKGDDMITRDGRKVRLCYHAQCFSGDADPRTQNSSSKSEGRLPESNFRDQAPRTKGTGKWTIANYGYTPALHATDVMTVGALRLGRAGSSAGKPLGQVGKAQSFSAQSAAGPAANLKFEGGKSGSISGSSSSSLAAASRPAVKSGSFSVSNRLAVGGRARRLPVGELERGTDSEEATSAAVTVVNPIGSRSSSGSGRVLKLSAK